MINPAWISGLFGGLMIGAAAAMFLLVNGRIMGASGILGGTVDGSGWSNIDERLAFLAGLIGVPALAALIWQPPQTNLTTNPLTVVVAGLLVGLGTRMGNGCTSGHGVCGISRFSKRGIVATLVYLAAGMLAMTIASHGLGVI